MNNKCRNTFRAAVLFLILVVFFASLLYIVFGGGLFFDSKRIESAIHAESGGIKCLVDERANLIESRLEVVEGKLDRIEAKIDLLIKMATPVLPDGMKEAN